MKILNWFIGIPFSLMILLIESIELSTSVLFLVWLIHHIVATALILNMICFPSIGSSMHLLVIMFVIGSWMTRHKHVVLRKSVEITHLCIFEVQMQ